MSRDRVPAPRAISNYRGMRITITQAPGDEEGWVSVSVKQPSGHWDEWNLLFPAFRSPTGEVQDAGEVLALLAGVCDQAAARSRE